MTRSQRSPEPADNRRKAEMAEAVKIIECPRDAWQGLAGMIPTEVKADYLRALLAAGFAHIDAVSFVSPRYVPQMADSEAVLEQLFSGGTKPAEGSEIIGIVVNEKGLDRALRAPGVTTVGYPHSVSERFQRENAHISAAASRALVEQLAKATEAAGRALTVYLSMAFGNPYGERWAPEMVAENLEWLRQAGVETVSLADTVGTASPELVGELFAAASEAADGIELGVHLHSRREGAREKVLAAYEAGCRRFDCALTGLGGCPFAGDELVGNIPTEIVLETLAGRGVETPCRGAALAGMLERTQELRARYAQE
jgi:hydroxymethylglutaryl-CoA lyase